MFTIYGTRLFMGLCIARVYFGTVDHDEESRYQRQWKTIFHRFAIRRKLQLSQYTSGLFCSADRCHCEQWVTGNDVGVSGFRTGHSSLNVSSVTFLPGSHHRCENIVTLFSWHVFCVLTFLKIKKK